MRVNSPNLGTTKPKTATSRRRIGGGSRFVEADELLYRGMPSGSLDKGVELKLGRRIQAGLLRSEPGNQVVGITPDGQCALNTLVNQYRLMVVKLARYYYEKKTNANGLDLCDYVQAGNAELVRLAYKYDPGRNCKFSTVAQPSLDNFYKRFTAEGFNCVRVPPNRRRKIRDAITCFHDTYGHYPLPSELTKKNGKLMFPLPQIILVLAELSPHDIHHLSTNHGDTVSTFDFVASIHTAAADDLEKQGKVVALERALKTLDDREQTIIKKRFGLDCETPLTLRELSEELDTTKERVRQIEREALGKLKEQMPELGFSSGNDD